MSLRASNLADAILLLLKPDTKTLDGMKNLNGTLGAVDSVWNKGITTIVAQDVKDSFDKNPLYTFYAHPIIKTLSKPGKLPAYISSTDFTTTLFDIFMKAGTQPVSEPAQFLTVLESSIIGLGNNDLKLAVLPYIQAAKLAEGSAEAKIAVARKNIEGWFNSTMDRASGWYKRRMQVMAIVISFAIVIVFNADSLAIVQSLWHDAGLRQSINALASSYADKNQAPQADQVLGQLTDLNLPLGWSGRAAATDLSLPVKPQDFPSTSSQWLLKILGLLVSGLAVSQGSAVWFDLLSKLINLRNNGVKPDMPAKKPAA